MIIAQFALYIEKCTIFIQIWMNIILKASIYIYRKVCDFHPSLEEYYAKSFQKWKKIGPPFSSTFGTGTYLLIQESEPGRTHQ